MKKTTSLRVISILMIVVAGWNMLRADSTYLLICSAVVVVSGLIVFILSFLKKEAIEKNTSSQDNPPEKKI